MTDVLRNSLLSINGSVGGVSEKKRTKKPTRHVRYLFDLQILSAAIV
jgi:hypothetical protein